MGEQSREIAHRDFTSVQIGKPDELIFSPQMISQGALYILNAVLLNERNLDAQENRERKIAIKDLRLLMGTENSHNAAYIDKCLKELVDMTITWGELADKKIQTETVVVIATFLQKATYLIGADGSISPERGFITYHLSDAMWEIITRRKAATDLMVVMQRQFQRPYSWKLYEFFQGFLKYQPEAKQIEIVKEVGFLRRLFDLTGYSDFAEFNRTILKPNIKELNELAEFSVEFTLLREGRNVAALKFIVTRKSSYQFSFDLSQDEKLPQILRQALESKQQDIERERAIKRLLDYKIARKVALDVIDERGLKWVLGVVEGVDADKAAGYKPRNWTAYMKAALAGDIIPGQQQQDTAREVPSEAMPYYEILTKDFGFKESEAGPLCSTYPPSQIDSALEYVREQLRKGKSIGKGFIIKAVREDYGAELRKDKEEREMKDEALRASVERGRNAYAELPPDRQEELLNEFKKRPNYSAALAVQEDFKKNGLDGQVFSMAFFSVFLGDRLAK
jgi:hypothetical protein